jgi:hypothetical protein
LNNSTLKSNKSNVRNLPLIDGEKTKVGAKRDKTMNPDLNSPKATNFYKEFMSFQALPIEEQIRRRGKGFKSQLR